MQVSINLAAHLKKVRHGLLDALTGGTRDARVTSTFRKTPTGTSEKGVQCLSERVDHLAIESTLMMHSSK